MKLYGIIVSIIVFCILTDSINANTTKTEFNLKNHLMMLTKMKTKTRAMLENLYISANRVEMQKHYTRNKKTLRTKNTSHLNTQFESTAQRSEHFSELNSKMLKKYKLKAKDYEQYRYLNFEEVVKKLEEFAQKYPDYFTLTTAQKLYNLPHPGGYCNLEKKL